MVDIVGGHPFHRRGRNRRAAADVVSDRMIEEICVFGSTGRCRAQLEAFREAGVSLPVLAVSPVNEERLEATHKALALLAPRDA